MMLDGRVFLNCLYELVHNSGWNLNRCVSLDLSSGKYQSFLRSSYIKVPTYIPKGTVISVKYNDDNCFEWAIISALY